MFLQVLICPLPFFTPPNMNLLVFDRKDLGEAKHKMQSMFKFSDVLFALSQMDPL